MNTRCLTSATMRIRPGPHSWRVIARNRYGAHSSEIRAFSAGAGAPSPQTTLRQNAERELRAAADELRRAVAGLVDSPGDFLRRIGYLAARGRLTAAIAAAKRAGLRGSAKRYQRLLDGETRRGDQLLNIGGLLGKANSYGQKVAQRAHENDPSLTPAALGDIELNASNSYSNSALRNSVLAKAVKKGRIYEVTVTSGESLDNSAEKVYRAISVGAKKVSSNYKGAEGLYTLPDAKGGFSGRIGFRAQRRVVARARRSTSTRLRPAPLRFISRSDEMLPRPASSRELPVALRAFDSLFCDVEPFGCPFQPAVAARALIYPTGPFGFDADEFSALLSAVEVSDRDRCFVSTSTPSLVRDDTTQYVVSPLDFETYSHPSAYYVLISHVLYPPSGAWGIVTSNESQVLAGGSEQFITKLLQGLGRSQAEMIAAWLTDWREHQDRDPGDEHHVGDWIPAQLAHVVGPARAERALSASKLRRWD